MHAIAEHGCRGGSTSEYRDDLRGCDGGVPVVGRISHDGRASGPMVTRRGAGGATVAVKSVKTLKALSFYERMAEDDENLSSD